MNANMNNNPCNANANLQDIQRRVRTNFFVPKKFASKMSQENICSAYKNCKNATSLPPMKFHQSMGKFYLLDSKSPLSAKDYKILFANGSKVSQLKLVSKKLDIVFGKDVKITKTLLRTNIIENLRKMNIKEPILIPIRCREKVKKNAANNKNNLNVDPNFNLPKNNNLNGINNQSGAKINNNTNLNRAINNLNKTINNLNNQGRRLNNQGRPLNNLRRPLNNLGRPLNNLGRPMNNQGRPLNNLGRPLNNLGRPLNNQGRRLNNQGRPLNNQGRPMNNTTKKPGFFSKLFGGSGSGPKPEPSPFMRERQMPINNKKTITKKKRRYDNYSNLRAEAQEIRNMVE